MVYAKSRRERLRFTTICYALLLPTYVLLSIFTFVPVSWAFIKSLYQFEIGAPETYVGLSNYAQYFRDPTFLPSFGTMLFLTAFAVVARLTMPMFVAKLIISLPTERVRHAYRILFLAPIVVPGVAMQLIWRGLIYGQDGALNKFLATMGLAHWQHGWLSDPNTALLALAFIGFPFVGGFEVLIYYAGLAAIPESVNDSARIDGAKGLYKFFRIDLPMVLNQIRLIVALTVIAGVQAFDQVFIVTKGGPGYKTLVPGLWMYFNAFSFQRMGYACAIGVVLFFVIAILTAINLKYLKTTEEMQS